MFACPYRPIVTAWGSLEWGFSLSGSAHPQTPGQMTPVWKEVPHKPCEIKKKVPEKCSRVIPALTCLGLEEHRPAGGGPPCSLGVVALSERTCRDPPANCCC